MIFEDPYIEYFMINLSFSDDSVSIDEKTKYEDCLKASGPLVTSIDGSNIVFLAKLL